MKTVNRIMGIISVSLCVLCIIPTIIGMFSGASLMSDEQLAYRAIAYILFELFVFIGGIIAVLLSTKPAATIFASVLLIVAGFLQISFNTEFSLVFIGSISLLILSWAAFISIVFGLVILVCSIKNIRKSKNENLKNEKSVIREVVKEEKSNIVDIGECCSIKRCTNCGIDLPDEAKFCPECGHEVVLINNTIQPETNIVVKKNKKIKPLFFILGIVLLISVVGLFINSVISNSSILPANANEDELKLINYIIENGIYDEDNKEYFISETTTEAGIDFQYSITYNTKTKKLTFRDTSLISSGMTITTMNYEYGAEEQSVSVNMAISGGNGVTSKGVIYPATYTNSNRTIYSFESSYSDTRMKSICETSVYQMLTHCQLIMIYAGTGMVSFGFENGLFK